MMLRCDRLERADVTDRLQAGAPALEVLPRRVTPPAGLAVPPWMATTWLPSSSGADST